MAANRSNRAEAGVRVPPETPPPIDVAAWVFDRDAFLRRLVMTLALGPPRIARYRPPRLVEPPGASLSPPSRTRGAR